MLRLKSVNKITSNRSGVIWSWSTNEGWSIEVERWSRTVVLAESEVRNQLKWNSWEQVHSLSTLRRWVVRFRLAMTVFFFNYESEYESALKNQLTCLRTERNWLVSSKLRDESSWRVSWTVKDWGVGVSMYCKKWKQLKCHEWKALISLYWRHKDSQEHSTSKSGVWYILFPVRLNEREWRAV